MCPICENGEDGVLLINMEKVHCYSCPFIVKIPSLPNVKLLDFYECKNLEEIEVMPNLEVLWIATCPLFKKIPAMPNVEGLYLYNVIFTEIPVMPKLMHIALHTLRFIGKIPMMQNLLHLNCEKCPLLNTEEIENHKKIIEQKVPDLLKKLVSDDLVSDILKYCR